MIRERLASLLDADRDPAYSALILAGPLVVAAIAIAGRSLATTALAAAYLLAVVGTIAWRAVGG